MRKRAALKEAHQLGLLGPRDIIAALNADRPDQVMAFIAEMEGATGNPLVNANGDLCLFDAIDSWGGFWGISRPEVDSALEHIGDTENLTVRINSPGGEVTEGMAIYSALVDHPADVLVIVEGMAASMGSIIAMTGDRITMNHGAEMMIHESRGMIAGPAGDLEDYAARLRRMNDQGADVYAARSGNGDRAFWLEQMAAETWYHGDAAVEIGLADDTVPFKSKKDTSTGSEQGSAGGWSRKLFAVIDDGGKTSTGEVAPDPETPVPAATAAGRSERQRAQQVVAKAQLALGGVDLG
ncbi:MAG: head maturation protease, ClpP-related [Actinomycetota bacterium]